MAMFFITILYRSSGDGLGLILLFLVIGVIIIICTAVVEFFKFLDRTYKKVKSNFIKEEPLRVKIPSPIEIKPAVSTVNQFEQHKEAWVKEQIKTLDEAYTIFDLLKSKEIKNIYYSDLLSCVEWKFKRLTVLIRDKYKCQDCQAKSKFNHVHHTYYLKDSLPWLIDSMALVTVCNKCHFDRHKKDDIGVYVGQYHRNSQLTRGKFQRAYYTNLFCNKCGGSGYLPEFSHRDNGICYQCLGGCIDKTIFSVALESVKVSQATNNIHQVRADYKQYLQGISTDVYEKSIHIASESKLTRYERHDEKPVNWGSADDDLPF